MEISKAIMYTYLYKVLKPSFGSRVMVMYSDTDSLIYCLKTSNYEKDIACIENTLDRNSTLFKFKVKRVQRMQTNEF